MREVYCIICAQDQMSCWDILGECGHEKWLPILVVRKDEKTFVPFFNSPDIAFKFAKRNLPKKWLLGHMNIGPEDEQFIRGKGWEITLYEWPKKLDGIKFDVEIVEYEDEREINVPWKHRLTGGRNESCKRDKKD